MLKFIKHNLEEITGIAIFPMISFLIFFVFFILTFVWTFSMDKKLIREIENIPLDDSQEKNS